MGDSWVWPISVLVAWLAFKCWWGARMMRLAMRGETEKLRSHFRLKFAGLCVLWLALAPLVWRSDWCWWWAGLGILAFAQVMNPDLLVRTESVVSAWRRLREGRE